MRSVSVLVEISDEVYTDLVEPMKKNKSFGKLVASLLNGYLNVPEVRAYADETISEMKKASIDYLDNTIAKMQESLSSMGMFTDELNSVVSSAHSHFKEKADEQSKVVESSDIQTNVPSNELSDVYKRLDNLSSQVQFLVDIFSQKGLSIQIGDPLIANTFVSPSTTSQESQVESNIVNVSDSHYEEHSTVTEPVIEEAPKDVPVVVKENTTDDVEEPEVVEDKRAMDVMNSLLSDNFFSF